MSIIATTTPANRRALTTVERYRDMMPETDVMDAKIETLISQVSTAIEAHLGRKLARERVTERFREESGTKVYLLERTPVLTLHGVKLEDQTLEATAWHLDEPEGGLLCLDGSGGQNALWDELVGDYGGGAYGYRGGRPVQVTVEVDYTAGYIVPGQTFDEDDTPTLPGDIEAACQAAVRGFLEAIDRPAGLTSEKLGDASWTYAQGSGGRGFLSGDTKLILAPYRRLMI